MAEDNKKSWLTTALKTAGGVGLNALTGGLGSVFSGVVGDLFGGIFGKSDAEKTAEMQMQIARETNEMNYKIWQEQRQAEVDMWNMNNEYNTPEAQRQRLEDAGFSPYAMLGQGGNIGMSSSAPSTGQAPTMQQAQIPLQESRFMQGLRAMQQTTASSLALSQAGLADSQANRIETLLPLESDQILENINYMKKLGFTQDELKEVYRQQSENLFEQNSFLRATYADRVSQQANLTMQSRAQTTLMGLDVQERQFVSQYFAPQAWVDFATSLQQLSILFLEGKVKEGSLNEQIARIAKLYSDIDLNNALEMESDARYWNIKSITEGNNIDNASKAIDLKAKLPPEILKKLAWQVFKSELSRNILEKNQSDMMNDWHNHTDWWYVPASKMLDLGKGFF